MPRVSGWSSEPALDAFVDEAVGRFHDETIDRTYLCEYVHRRLFWESYICSRRNAAAAYPKPLARALAMMRDTKVLTFSVRDMARRQRAVFICAFSQTSRCESASISAELPAAAGPHPAGGQRRQYQDHFGGVRIREPRELLSRLPPHFGDAARRVSPAAAAERLKHCRSGTKKGRTGGRARFS